MFSKARIFVSYARADAKTCQVVTQALRERGYSCFVDSEATLIGEKFPQRIRDELKRTDGVLALLTPSAANSEWCQAELYHALALGKPVAPVLIGVRLEDLPSPLAHSLRDRNFLEIESTGGLSVSSLKIVESLDEVRRSARKRVIRNGLRTAGLLIGIAALLTWLPSRINAWSRASERGQTIDRLLASEIVLSEQSIAELAAPHAGDDTTIAELKIIEHDGERSDTARVNAKLLATALLSPPPRCQGSCRLNPPARRPSCMGGAARSLPLAG